MPVASAAHAYLYRASRGRVATRVGGKPVLLLTTVDDDGAVAIHAFDAAGAERHRLWRLGCSDNRAYERAQARSPRTFPIVILDPQESR
jgi:hypothetical protein